MNGMKRVAAIAALLVGGSACVPGAPGRVLADYSAKAPHALFAGTTGHIYQSTDAGATWRETDGGLASGAVYPLISAAGITVDALPEFA